jgi:UDPglucose 6-dehydrogenase
MGGVIGFAGLSHLGIVSSAAAAARGFTVVAYDPDAALVADLREGRLPVHEPNLPELLHSVGGRLTYTAEPSALAACSVVVLSRDVATDAENRSDLSALDALAESVADELSEGAVLVLLSQVRPGHTRGLGRRLAPVLLRKGIHLHYQVETLIFGRAVERALKPERFMVGCADPRQALPPAYQELLASFGCPILPMRYESAELAKIAINIFLTTSVTAANTLADVCERIGADWGEIAPALRLDARIGPHAYLSPGLGLAGGNLERDLHSTKNSPSLALIEALHGVTIRAYDPQVSLAATADFRQEKTPLAACVGANALAVMTPWAEFAHVDLAMVRRAMAGRLLVDPYGCLDADLASRLGFHYFKLGRPAQGRSTAA